MSAFDADHPEALAALNRLETQLQGMGQMGLVSRLGQLRARGGLWVAPSMGPERWAAYVEALGLVRRIYVRGPALLDPRAHLYAGGAPAIPVAFQNAFAWLSLAGAMRHELKPRIPEWKIRGSNTRKSFRLPRVRF